MSHVAPAWLPFAATVAAAFFIWLAIMKPGRRVSLSSLLLLLTFLAIAFAIGRHWWERRGKIDVLPNTPSDQRLDPVIEAPRSR
jgi:hypothetical protein